jgi:hypothetical protein
VQDPVAVDRHGALLIIDDEGTQAVDAPTSLPGGEPPAPVV